MTALLRTSRPLSAFAVVLTVAVAALAGCDSSVQTTATIPVPAATTNAIAVTYYYLPG